MLTLIILGFLFSPPPSILKALGMSEETFNAIDVDGSGKLTDEEVAAWQALNAEGDEK